MVGCGAWVWLRTLVSGQAGSSCGNTPSPGDWLKVPFAGLCLLDLPPPSALVLVQPDSTKPGTDALGPLLRSNNACCEPQMRSTGPLDCRSSAPARHITLVIFLMAAHTRAALWSDTLHKKAVLALHTGAATVDDGRGHYWSKVERQLMPSLPSAGHWYVHFGSKPFDAALMELLPKPDNGASPPNSGAALRTQSLTGIDVSLVRSVGLGWVGLGRRPQHPVPRATAACALPSSSGQLARLSQGPRPLQS